MIVLISQKINRYFYKSKTPSASMLTCRRHAVDTTQTLTQTIPLTFDEQKDRIKSFPGSNGIIPVILEKAVISLFLCFWFRRSSQ
ncbi:MAG: hypothetical protein CL609_22145 [Anaerolineaceae bacterium]|jgi:hypothetical protein|nr:hypothetical protein [Anaerolineaceae bacterium]